MTRLLTILCVLSLPLAGCETAGGPVPPVAPGDGGGSDDDDPIGDQETNTLDGMNAAMLKLEKQQTELVEAASTSQDRCEESCELSGAICRVQAKVCTVAEEFPQNGDYQEACRKAKNRCAQAQKRCTECVQSHASSAKPAKPDLAPKRDEKAKKPSAAEEAAVPKSERK